MKLNKEHVFDLIKALTEVYKEREVAAARQKNYNEAFKNQVSATALNQLKLTIEKNEK